MKKSIVSNYQSAQLVALISAVLMTISVAEAKKPKLPDARVITQYEKPYTIETSTSNLSAGSGQETSFTQADLSRIGVVSDSYPKTIAIMESILQDIRANSPDQSINPKVQLFNSASPEARAINSDLIIIATGFFSMISEHFPDEKQQSDALAFILAHEYAHLLYGHPRLYKERQDDTVITDDLTTGYQMMKTVQATHSQIGGTNNEAFYSAEKAYMGATVASPWIEAELYRAVYAPYVKEQELLADFMASDLLSDPENPNTKFDSRSGSSPIRSLYKSYDDSMRGKLKNLAKDVEKTMHTEVKNMTVAAPAAAVNSINGGTNFGAQMTKHLKSAGVRFGLGKIKQRLDRKNVHLYYSAKDRVKAIHDYTDLFYPAREETLSGGDLAMFGISGTFAAEHTPSSAATQAMTFLARGDIDGAANALDQVTEEKRFDNIQYLVASADVALAQLELEKAIALYRQAIRRIDAPVRAYSSLSKAHMRAGNDDKVIEALDLGARKFSEHEFIVQKIDAQIALGRNEDALMTLQYCQSLGDESLYEQCEHAAEAAMPKPPADENENSGGFGLGKALGDVIKDVTNN